ncbi:hypothetical protein CRV156 [Nile crocodilepox virus]|uniref:Uncharacterized protein n=1 Tax=Nile crocodilepox virus (isolate Crocodylus niloticus/Zimbabwe/Ume/2001) TaxID=1289473 RepID=Q06ZZ5_CPRVZ|nr:hypothetical protein CRV156 [Nile crocodilepox virus]ABJ09047.1 hypothetical protein CRV156 [Nile crocodilepox virus]
MPPEHEPVRQSPLRVPWCVDAASSLGWRKPRGRLVAAEPLAVQRRGPPYRPVVIGQPLQKTSRPIYLPYRPLVGRTATAVLPIDLFSRRRSRRSPFASLRRSRIYYLLFTGGGKMFASRPASPANFGRIAFSLSCLRIARSRAARELKSYF